MNLQNKVILAHAGFFNKECQTSFRENSKEVCQISGAKDYIDIIELDLRKSKDGILYCYHGTLIQYYTTFKAPQKFSDIKRKYNVDSLAEILDVIAEEKGIFLDIKDTSITRDDILKTFLGREFKEIILGNKSTSFLERFNKMPEGFVKILNGNILCDIYDFEKAT